MSLGFGTIPSENIQGLDIVNLDPYQSSAHQLNLIPRHFAVDETKDVVYLCDPSPFRLHKIILKQTSNIHF